MERTIITADAAEVRTLIAEVLCVAPRSRSSLGTIQLRQHQLSAVSLIEDAFARSGGVLLADDVGLGKTYVALAVARSIGATLVIAPASLRDMWRSASTAAGVPADFASFEAVSRGWKADGVFDLFIIDEAHHLRNPRTVRYRALAAMTRRARILLLSATPVHNRARDLRSLLALFLGERASTLSGTELARYVIRRGRSEQALQTQIPAVARTRWLPTGCDDDLLGAICALPPPLPPSDGGDAGALAVYALVRLWASSQGALLQGVRRRIAQAMALRDALEQGRHPSRSELRAWSMAEEAVQLAFPELIVSHHTADAARFLATVEAHRRGLQALLAQLREAPDTDAERIAQLLAVRRLHAGRKVVAFTQYADTARTLFGRMRGEARVALLTGDGGRIAGGELSRAEILARFAPHAQGRAPPREVERIDLLITTDLLSEGVNLQDASVVVHLDLPWTAARLEQRVGRAARLGASHQRVDVYALTPPASAERLLDVERRLREKITAAEEEVGAGDTMLSLLGLTASPSSAAALAERLRQLLARWHSPDTSARRGAQDTATLVAAVRSPRSGLLALFESDPAVLVASLDGAFSDDPEVVAEAVALASGPGVHLPAGLLDQSLSAVERYREWKRGALDADVEAVPSGATRRAMLKRIAMIAARTPFHERARRAPLLADARRVARAPLGAGAEHALHELTRSPIADEAWLHALARIAEEHRRPEPDGSRALGALRGLLVLRLEG